MLQMQRQWEANGAPEEIRTPDPQIRSLVLYPAELRARIPSCGGEGEIAEAQPPHNPENT
jgi:hypothetical protein